MIFSPVSVEQAIGSTVDFERELQEKGGQDQLWQRPGLPTEESDNLSWNIGGLDSLSPLSRYVVLGAEDYAGVATTDPMGMVAAVPEQQSGVPDTNIVGNVVFVSVVQIPEFTPNVGVWIGSSEGYAKHIDRERVLVVLTTDVDEGPVRLTTDVGEGVERFWANTLLETRCRIVTGTSVWSDSNFYWLMGSATMHRVDDVHLLDASYLAITEAELEEVSEPGNRVVGQIEALRDTRAADRAPWAKWPTDRTFDDAVQFVNAWPSEEILPPDVGLADDGEVNFLWKRAGLHVDLGFYGDGTFSYYARDGAGIPYRDDDVPAHAGLPTELIAILKA